MWHCTPLTSSKAATAWQLQNSMRNMAHLPIHRQESYIISEKKKKINPRSQIQQITLISSHILTLSCWPHLLKYGILNTHTKQSKSFLFKVMSVTKRLRRPKTDLDTYGLEFQQRHVHFWVLEKALYTLSPMPLEFKIGISSAVE